MDQRGYFYRGVTLTFMSLGSAMFAVLGSSKLESEAGLIIAYAFRGGLGVLAVLGILTAIYCFSISMRRRG